MCTCDYYSHYGFICAIHAKTIATYTSTSVACNEVDCSDVYKVLSMIDKGN